MNTELGQVRIFPLDDLRPASINDVIYRPVHEDDPEIIELAKSMKQHGILTPLSITRDCVIVSGHRRATAARLAGIFEVPVIVLDLYSDDAAFPGSLVESNRTREKTNEERLREAIALTSDEDPYAAWRRLREYREERAVVAGTFVEISAGKGRAEITSAKEPMLKAIEQVLKERRSFWPLSDRQIHYALLNLLPLKHASKPNSVYENNLLSYKTLCELLTRARLVGRIPLDAIADETRPVTVWDVHQTPSSFLTREIDNFLRGYARDLQQDQPNHIEIVAEKNTLRSIVEPIAGDFAIPVTVGRGYCSLPPRHKMAKRFKASGREKLILLVLSDHDPDGMEILKSFARSMRDDFGIDTQAHKVALTAEQIIQYQLPPSMEAKASSSQYGKFSQEFGKYAYELESLSPETLQFLLKEAIYSVIDAQTLEKQRELEAQDAHEIDGRRRMILEVLKGI